MTKLQRLEELIRLEEKDPRIDNEHIRDLEVELFNMRYELLALARAAQDVKNFSPIEELYKALEPLEREE